MTLVDDDGEAMLSEVEAAIFCAQNRHLAYITFDEFLRGDALDYLDDAAYTTDYSIEGLRRWFDSRQRMVREFYRLPG